jgi:hypothetical protein
MNHRWRALALVVALLVGIPTLHAQTQEERDRPANVEEQIDALNRDSEAAFARKDYKAAEQIVRRVTELDPDNFVPWYNLACALSSQGKTEEAGPAIEKAIELGFSDLRHMEQDPHLAPLRATENYKKLIAGWNDILAAQSEQRLELAKKRYGPSYTYERDEKHRLAYASAFPADSFAHAKDEITRTLGWWEKYVSSPGEGADAPKAPVFPWVLVVLPNQRDYASFARARYGDAWQRIGGVYSHDNKTLVAKDIGSTLRHEFWHVLHWRDMDRLGQRHPIWIMEGLCSLFEDVEVNGGVPRPLASYRTNQAGQLARTGKLTPWEVMFKLDQKKFIGTRPLAFYGQSRSIFMWLYDIGKLREWYAAYTASYKDDPSGLKAFEVVFNKPAKQVERDFKAWMRSFPIVQDDFPVGSAILPFGVDPVGAGDGVQVAPSDVLERVSGKPGSGRLRTGGIMPRDVVLSIDGKAVREFADLVRVLGDYAPGADVKVTYRRGQRTETTSVTLVEKR